MEHHKVYFHVVFLYVHRLFFLAFANYSKNFLFFILFFFAYIENKMFFLEIKFLEFSFSTSSQYFKISMFRVYDF
jgi:hypothetical protein